MHRQAMFIFFALDALLYQMPGKPFAGTLGLGTVCKGAMDAQRAIDGQGIHGLVSGWFEPLIE